MFGERISQSRRPLVLSARMSPILETFENPSPGRIYFITHTFPEWTSLCPKTGQPDFATIVLEYVPDALCIELKALKLYYNAFRNEGMFFETLVNRLLDDLAGACRPRWMQVTGEFHVRGGIASVVRAATGPRPEA